MLARHPLRPLLLLLLLLAAAVAAAAAAATARAPQRPASLPGPEQRPQPRPPPPRRVLAALAELVGRAVHLGDLVEGPRAGVPAVAEVAEAPPDEHGQGVQGELLHGHGRLVEVLLDGRVLVQEVQHAEERVELQHEALVGAPEERAVRLRLHVAPQHRLGEAVPEVRVLGELGVALRHVADGGPRASLLDEAPALGQGVLEVLGRDVLHDLVPGGHDQSVLGAVPRGEVTQVGDDALQQGPHEALLLDDLGVQVHAGGQLGGREALEHDLVAAQGHLRPEVPGQAPADVRPLQPGDVRPLVDVDGHEHRAVAGLLVPWP
mmetsp:Transcript_45851/g.141723  ORF Transcript_45851/g.141723 Transcript_45851/m.141723 type:complete len:320 (+) Transcript_45851:160-1119(+)